MARPSPRHAWKLASRTPSPPGPKPWIIWYRAALLWSMAANCSGVVCGVMASRTPTTAAVSPSVGKMPAPELPTILALVRDAAPGVSGDVAALAPVILVPVESGRGLAPADVDHRYVAANRRSED